MQERSSLDKRKTEIRDRKEEATSKETLDELEEETKSVSEKQSVRIPSPDGASDKDDDLDDTGPM